MDFAKRIKPLGSESDWPMWKRKMRDLLDYHEGALDVIDKKLVKPEPLKEGATETEIKSHKETSDLYRKANSYAKSMITSSITDEVYLKIMDQECASEAWDMLKVNFEATAKDQLFKVCSEFFSFSWTQGDDVSCHIAKLKTLWNELNNGLKIKSESQLPELLLVCKTLHILPKEFENFKSSWMILTKDESKTFDEMTNQLCMFERNFLRNRNEGKFESAQEALVAKVGLNRSKFTRKPDTKRKDLKENDTCNYCKLKGHWVKDCQRWVADGKPGKAGVNQNTFKQGKHTGSSKIMYVSEEAYVCEMDPTVWWVDSGATKHITNCPAYFTEFQRFTDSHGVKAAGRETLNALGKGSIEMSNGTKLVDVWYVPEVSRNLFSTLSAQDKNPNNSEFRSTATNCYLKINNNIVLQGERALNGSLYKADLQPVYPKEQVEVNVLEDKAVLQLYHERWGHQDKRHVREMLKKELEVSLKLPLVTETCEPCIYGKAHKLPFGHRRKCTKPGELMSVDVCGPFDESFQKKKYLVLFKDNYTKFRYGFLVREKSEVKDVLVKVIQYTKTLDYKIQELLSDNGGEFDNREVKEILSKEGIVQRLTAPYTPQQNGNTERELRTVVEMARTLKFSQKDVEFPAAMWAELVSTSIYILNRTGKSSKEGISPYELWIGKKPRIKHLRIIGSTCYAHVPDQKRRKMDRKAVKGYLIGYDGDERYRIWIKEENKIVLSRDVVFQEITKECNRPMQVELLLKDRVSNEGKESDIQPNIQDNNFEENTENEDDEEEKETLFQHQLRDRSKLQKPTRFDDFVMMANDIINGIITPETYEEAVNSIQYEDWKQAMDNEMKSLEDNQTWELVNLPEGVKAIPSKWVYRVKTNPDGSIDKYKARLVIKGFNQRYGIDYKETFSPVAKMTTIRSMLSIAAREGLHLMQFDVSTAFLYGELEEAIYMKQPDGYRDNTNRVCKLKRSLYGLKQAPRCWAKRFGGFLLAKGFKSSHADQCLYIKEKNNKKMFVALYVDDGLVMATDKEDIECFLKELKNEFKITIKPASYFLGIEIEHIENRGIKISQKAYAKKILERFNFQDSKPVSTPIIKEPVLPTSNEESDKQSNFPYRQAVGALMYLMIGTRPDLAYSVSFLSRTLETPTEEDVVRLKRVLRYVKGTYDLGILYHLNSRCTLECYSDADFGGCSTTGRSTSGVIIKYAGGAISWISKRQAITATSTTEAELVAVNEATKEIIWLKRLFRGMTKLENVPVLQVDNQATVKLVHNPEFHHRTKHIRIKYFFVREKVMEGELRVEYIPTENQLADIMTKPLAKPRLLYLCKMMGIGA